MPGKGKPFKKGDKRAGRPKGRRNNKTVEKTLLMRMQPWIDGDEYTANVQTRILRGRAPHAESYFLQRLHGKPVEQVELSGSTAKPIKVVIEVVRG